MIQIKHNKLRIPTGSRLTSYLFTQCGGVEFEATEDKSILCAVYILYFIFCKISTDLGLLKIRHSHRFVAVVIQILIPFINI